MSNEKTLWIIIQTPNSRFQMILSKSAFWSSRWKNKLVLDFIRLLYNLFLFLPSILLHFHSFFSFVKSFSSSSFNTTLPFVFFLSIFLSLFHFQEISWIINSRIRHHSNFDIFFAQQKPFYRYVFLSLSLSFVSFSVSTTSP